MSSAMDGPHSFVARLDRDLRFLFVCQGYSRLHGVLPRDLVGRTMREVVSDEAFAEFHPFALRALAGKRVTFESTIGAGSDATAVLYTLVPEVDPDGTASGLVVIVVDVSARKRLEAALHRSERFGRMLEVSLNELYVFDAETLRFTDVNEGARRNLGYSLEQLRTLTPIDLKPEFTEASFREMIGPLVRRERPKHVFETLHRRADGTTYPVEVHLQLIDDGDTVFLAVITDITERRQSEQALRESEARFRGLLDSAPDAVLVVDRGGRITLANPAAERLFGYGPGELAGCGVDDLVPEAARERHAGLVEHFLRQPTSRPMGTGLDLVARRKDGTEFAVDIMLGPMEQPGLGGLAVLCIVRDVTERKRAEAELRRTRDQLWQAVEAGHVGLWEVDLRTNEVYYSPEWKRQIGYADDELSYDLEAWRSRVHPEDLERAMSAAEGYLNGTAPRYEIVYRLHHRDGSYRHVLVRGAKILADDGTPIKLSGSQVDITERLELQADLLQAQKMEVIGRLAGGVAHDFNNLLTVINGTADLAMTRFREGDELHGELREIREAGERAASLTRQLLAYSRRQMLRPEIVNLNGIVAGIEPMLRRLLGERVTLVLELSEGLSAVKVDPAQMDQVLMNLAVNARDAMPDGGVLTIATENIDISSDFASKHPSMQPGPHVGVSVRDTGIGMDEQTAKRIFEPYFTTKEAPYGTGLGLSTVYGILKQSGGSIWVDSAPQRGTAFTIYLPRAAEPALAEASVRVTTAAPGGHETILIVEDEDAVRLLASRLLSVAGYTVLTARDGEEALALVRRHEGEIHLMLTDVVLPGIGGGELAERLAGIRPGVKVLFTSGYTDNPAMRQVVGERGAPFIGKPYQITELRRRVREVLDS